MFEDPWFITIAGGIIACLIAAAILHLYRVFHRQLPPQRRDDADILDRAIKHVVQLPAAVPACTPKQLLALLRVVAVLNLVVAAFLLGVVEVNHEAIHGKIHPQKGLLYVSLLVSGLLGLGLGITWVASKWFRFGWDWWVGLCGFVSAFLCWIQSTHTVW